jgi:hypothetical protein
MKSLESMGYTSRRLAQKAFYSRARYIYSFELEQDPISLLQASLLMTYWHESPVTDSWHLMGEAISFSQMLNLPAAAKQFDQGYRRSGLLRRIWWCCLIRDTLVSLWKMRPTRLGIEEWDVDILTIQDFGFAQSQVKGDEDDKYKKSSRGWWDTELRREQTLANICIELAKLCQITTRILSAHRKMDFLSKEDHIPVLAVGVMVSRHCRV